jgi:hypothetical protein
MELPEQPERFLSMVCRACGRTIEPDSRVVERLLERNSAKALSRADCVYMCDCGMGYSNARDEKDRRQIAATPELNVPEPVRAGLDDVLGRAANVNNRRCKAWRFCSERSEDAVTWTVLRWLEQDKRLDVFRAGESEVPALLMWGAAVSGDDADSAADELEAISRDYGEEEDGRSEPDVILVWSDLVVTAEAKFHSANTRQRNYRNFSRYLRRKNVFSVPCEDVASAGFYELTRNWVLGIELAERLGQRDFLLVNLGSPALAVSANEFAALLAQAPSRRFTHRSWSSVVTDSSRLGRDNWFDEYAVAKQLYSL